MTCIPRILVFTVLTVVGTSCTAEAQKAIGVTVVPPATLSTFLATHKGPILDVRMEGDCSENHRLQREARSISFDLGAGSPDTRKMARDLFMSQFKADKRMSAATKRNETILVVCCAGGRSEAAAALLAENGIKVAHVPGGMQSAEIPAPVLKATK